MKRNELREHVDSIARRAERKGIKYWEGKQYPITEEREIDGEDVHVKYVALEYTDNYLNLRINLTRQNSFLDGYCPVGTNIILERVDDYKQTGVEENHFFFHCPDCGSRVSRQAETCPNCAWDNPSSGAIVMPVGHWIVYMATGFLLSLIIIVYLLWLGIGNF